MMFIMNCSCEQQLWEKRERNKIEQKEKLGCQPNLTALAKPLEVPKLKWSRELPYFEIN